MTTFAELTTIGVGGPIARFIEPTTRVGVIEAIEEADAKGLPLCVIGGGSNMLVSDAPFPRRGGARRPPRHHRARRGDPGGGRRPHRARQRRGRLQLGRLVRSRSSWVWRVSRGSPASPAPSARPWCRTSAPTARRSARPWNRWRPGTAGTSAPPI